MRNAMICLAVFVSYLAAAGAQDDAAKRALDGLQGVWKDENRSVVTFKGDQIFMSGSDGSAAKVKLESAKKPAEITMTDKLGAYQGIYELDGATLKFCFALHGQPRPKTFESPKGSKIINLVLKRDKK